MSDESFSPEWLALREPVDHRSRAGGLIPLLNSWWAVREGSHIVDLGSGTGSNLRYLAPLLRGEQNWSLVDHDAGLLAHAAPVDGVGRIERVRGDLAREGLAAVERADLVTASALLDLVSDAWLERLVSACVNARCAAFFALSYDGVTAWSDEDPEDALVLEAVNAHQRTDKGLGEALGPDAAAAAEQRFRDAGYRVWALESPWRLDHEDPELATQLVDGWAGAAIEMLPDDAVRIRAWRERRQAAIVSGAFVLVVGHVDLLALPGES